MKYKGYILPLVFFLVAATALFSGVGINTHDTRLMEQPAIGKSHIAFIYAGDLWSADLDGKNVRRLTSHEGMESHPVFSPDEKWIAFSAEYDGNTDVFIIPVEGGVPKRLTWHPYSDRVQGFTPDGKAVLFTSARNVHTFRYRQLFIVPVTGGMPTQLPVPYAQLAVYSPDGTHMAYEPLAEVFHQWKRYRGGTTSWIWVYRFRDHSVEKIPQPEERCNDTNPMWMGRKIYFRSDRNGEFNLFSFDPSDKKITQLTQHEDFPVLSASAGNGKIIYEQAGYLHIYDVAANTAVKLTVGIATDLPEVRRRYSKNDRFIRDAAISPSGARAVFEYRGEIITLPAEKGDPRNITNTTGANERSPSWSPDGKFIAYFSDSSGEYELHIKSQDGKGKKRSYKLNGAGFYHNPIWSPDNKKIVYTDNSRSIYWINLETGKCKKIGSEYFYEPGPFPMIKASWSPDSNWIAYTLNSVSILRRIYLYSLEQDKSFSITDGLSEANYPVFDPSGKYLYFLVSTDAGPVRDWFSQTTDEMQMHSSIYMAVLQKDIPSPLAKKSDEEKSDLESSKSLQTESKSNKKGRDNKVVDKKLDIQLEDLEYRILCLPVPEGDYIDLQLGEEGQLYYLKRINSGYYSYRPPEGEIHLFSLEEQKDEIVMADVNNFLISANNKKLLYRSGMVYGIISSDSKPKPGEGKLDIGAMQVYIDPAVEWAQIYEEAWRINRDYFYDPNMHGVDWSAMKKKYEVFLPHLSCRRDLNRVIQWLCSELSVGHHGVGGGDTSHTPERISGGLLGADYAVENGHFRFKKIYGGLNWNPQLRSPLTEPGVDIRTGEYLLAVNGKELDSSKNLFRYFENTAEKIIEITVGPNPNMKDSRTVTVVPIGGEYSLRNRDWVESNIRKVDKATNGRVAYVHVPNTARAGYIYFKRYFYPQINKDAIIIDERYNAGGQVPDYYIDLLMRPHVCNWATRYGADIKTPSASIQGPKVMLIDENAGSGGDLLPWMFRKFKIGKLIGKRTWGGLVGTLGYPTLMDGGRVTAPNLAIWTEDGWVVENVGVPPDIEVEQEPAKVIAGHDPQLEKAIEVIMKELEKNPPKKLIRPPYPNKAKK